LKFLFAHDQKKQFVLRKKNLNFSNVQNLLVLLKMSKSE